MNYLLDTHALIWYASASTQLSLNAREIIENTENNIFISIISLFELSIKFNIGKLETTHRISDFFDIAHRNNISILSINKEHLSQYTLLPLFDNHKDPFDKLIIATAMIENLTIVTTDRKFELYKEMVGIIW